MSLTERFRENACLQTLRARILRALGSVNLHVQLTKKKSAGYTVRELEELKQVIDRSVESNCGKSQDCDACSAKRTIISLCRVIAILKMLCCFQFVWGIKMDILLGRIIS